VSEEGLEGGGESSHKVQCKSLIEIRARYVEKTKREIEEQMPRFGVSSSSVGNSQRGRRSQHCIQRLKEN
jgi:hypothetical protein